MKNLILISMLVLLLTACNNTEPATTEESTTNVTDTASETSSPELLMLTLEELAEYNGKDGQPAYVAVDGIIYDMTNSSFWQEGDHNGFEAGQDLTEPLNKQSPHGSSKLKNVPIVGKLVETSSQSVEDEKTEEASSTATSDDTIAAIEPEKLMLTLSELAKFNGKDGQAAYVAVDGIIYDMTNSPLWQGGGHNGFEAGQDLTEPLMNQSPHGSVKLENVPIVGELVESSGQTMEDEKPEETSDETIAVTEPEMLMLTLTELAKFNGKDGQAAYVAIDGIIYDMTNSSLWQDGGHNGFEAGQDLTDPLMNQSPHGSIKLNNVPVVGQLVEEPSDAMEDTSKAEISTESETELAGDDMSSNETEAIAEEAPAMDLPSDSDNNGLIEYTIKQLSQFTGKDGTPAYIGYKNLVYDVSHLGPWSGGQHNGNYAGLDLTDDLAYASHGEEKLDKAIIVGELVK